MKMKVSTREIRCTWAAICTAAASARLQLEPAIIIIILRCMRLAHRLYRNTLRFGPPGAVCCNSPSSDANSTVQHGTVLDVPRAARAACVMQRARDGQG